MASRVHDAARYTPTPTQLPFMKGTFVQSNLLVRVALAGDNIEGACKTRRVSREGLSGRAFGRM